MIMVDKVITSTQHKGPLTFVLTLVRGHAWTAARPGKEVALCTRGETELLLPPGEALGEAWELSCLAVVGTRTSSWAGGGTPQPPRLILPPPR